MNMLKKIRKGDSELGKQAEGSGSLFRREIEKAFDRTFRAFDVNPWEAMKELAPWPAIDADEDEKSIKLRVDLPGLDAKDVDVEVSDHELTIAGAREEEKEENNGGYQHERYSGSFSRTIALPEYADTEKVEAKFEKGVLTIAVPKIPSKSPKKVAVKA